MTTVITATPLMEGGDNSMKKIVILLLIIGLVMIFIGYYREKDLTPFPQIIYKYIPKSYHDELFHQAPVRSIFGRMFNNASPWHSAKPGYDRYEPIYSYNHFSRQGAYNFYDNQDTYQEY